MRTDLIEILFMSKELKFLLAELLRYILFNRLCKKIENAILQKKSPFLSIVSIVTCGSEVVGHAEASSFRIKKQSFAYEYGSMKYSRIF